MKILHTSDLHLGATLYGYDRSDDHRQMLASIAETARVEKPDAVLVSGDIFDSGTPSAASQTMLSEWLVQMRDVLDVRAPIVLTAGNHDSPSRHEAHASAFRRMDIYMIGTLAREHQLCPDKCIIEVPGKGWIGAVPYLNARNMNESLFLDLGSRIGIFNVHSLPVVYMAHTTVAGSDAQGHSIMNESTVGGIDSVELNSLGGGYDYLALGHIHKPQTFRTGASSARYCGTPLHISFDERHQPSVSIVSLDLHGHPPTIETVPVECGSPLVTIGGARGIVSDDVLGVLEQAIKGADIPPGSYIRLNVAVTEAHPYPEVELTQMAREMCERSGMRFCLTHAVHQTTDTAASTLRTMSLSGLRDISATDLARDFASHTDAPWTDDMERALHEVINSLNNFESNE